MHRLPRFWDRLPFAARLLVTASLALLVAGFIMLYTSTRRDAAEAEADLRAQLAAELHTLPPSLAELLVIGDYATLQQTLDRYVQRPNVAFIRYRDAAGATLTARDRPPAHGVPPWFAGWIGLTDQRGEADAAVGGRTYGSLELVITAEHAIGRAWNRLVEQLSILLLAIALDFLGIYLVLRTGLAPLRALDAGSRALGAGQLSVRIAPRGSPELRRSITAFNQMASDLEALVQEVRASNAALAREKERIQVTLSSIGDGVISTDGAGLVEFMNPVAQQLTGWSEAQARGRPLGEVFRVVTESEGRPVPCPVARVLREGRVVGLASHTLLVARDGTERPIADSAAPIRAGEEGEMRGAVLVFQDRSEAREKMARLTESEERLRQLNENLEQRVAEELVKNRENELLLIQQSRLAAMGEMVHNIAHQWRQPINALALVLANIEDAYHFDELTREQLERLVQDGHRLVQRMSTTIDDFRNFFRPDKEKVRFSIATAVSDVRGLLGATLAHNGIALVEAVPEQAYAFGYPNEFAQVLLNLVSNAKEAIIAARASDGRIEISVGREAEAVVVRVSDNGGGVPPEVLPKIFDPYFTTKEKGTGIGLYMSQIIISHMGGAIGARNHGEGAELLIRLPRPEPEIAAETEVALG